MGWNFDRSLAVGGIALTIVLLVLDRAGKLKGAWLLVLLALAVFLLMPIVLTIPWVSHGLPGSQIWARRLLVLSSLAVLWAGLSVWVTSGNHPSDTGLPIPPKLSPTAEKSLNLELVPHGDASTKLILDVTNNGTPLAISASLRIIGSNSPNLFKTESYKGTWIVLRGRRTGRQNPTYLSLTTQIDMHGTEKLLIARAHAPQDLSTSRMKLSGIDENIAWENTTKGQLPYFDIEVKLIGAGYPNTLVRRYRVGPKKARGPLEMTEVSA